MIFGCSPNAGPPVGIWVLVSQCNSILLTVIPTDFSEKRAITMMDLSEVNLSKPSHSEITELVRFFSITLSRLFPNIHFGIIQDFWMNMKWCDDRRHQRSPCCDRNTRGSAFTSQVRTYQEQTLGTKGFIMMTLYFDIFLSDCHNLSVWDGGQQP